MALVATHIVRSFKFNGMSLTDPCSEMDLDTVKRFYANQFPELLNSVVEGQVTKGAVSTYTFVRAVGAKGIREDRPQSVIATIKKMTLGTNEKKSLFLGMTENEIKENILCSAVLKTVVNSTVTRHPLPLPQQAFGIWG